MYEEVLWADEGDLPVVLMEIVNRLCRGLVSISMASPAEAIAISQEDVFQHLYSYAAEVEERVSALACGE